MRAKKDLESRKNKKSFWIQKVLEVVVVVDD